MNPIEYLVDKGFRITSDPNEYRESYPDGERNPWGLRNYHENGRNMDQYCNGYHRAYDMSDTDGADIPSIADGAIIDGTRDNGTFGGQVVVLYEDLGVQVIYGHVQTPLIVEVGQGVKQGETIAYQGSTNNQGVNMSSHLHIQFQELGYLDEWEFTCTGIDPLSIDVNKYKGVD